MELVLFTSAFCGACAAARAAVTDAVRLIPDATLAEVDVALAPERAHALDIRSTPTVLIRDDDGTVVFRAEGAPTVSQVLVAAARTLPAATVPLPHPRTTHP